MAYRLTAEFELDTTSSIFGKKVEPQEVHVAVGKDVCGNHFCSLFFNSVEVHLDNLFAPEIISSTTEERFTPSDVAHLEKISKESWTAMLTELLKVLEVKENQVNRVFAVIHGMCYCTECKGVYVDEQMEGDLCCRCAEYRDISADVQAQEG